MSQVVHVVMGGGIVLATYRRVDLAIAHARQVTGVDVVAVDLDDVGSDLRDCIEVLDELPAEIRSDIQTEWERSEDVTPSIVTISPDDFEDDFNE